MFTAIDLFCGAGGLHIGFARAGFEILLALDSSNIYVKTHELNFPDIPIINRDIRTVSGMEIREIIDNNKIDMVIGGPPCQGFSTEGRRRFMRTRGYDPLSDDRIGLVQEFTRLVGELQPLYFVMENVSGLISFNKGNFIEEIINGFHDIGYGRVEYKLLRAADYGTPQIRRRTFIIGNRIDRQITFPGPTHFETPVNGQARYRTVGQAIMDLVDKTPEDVPNHVPMRHNSTVTGRMSYIPEGGNLSSSHVPENLLWGSRSDYKNRKTKRYSSVYRRLHRDRPSVTLVPGHNAFPIHPTLDRSLTVREAARLQGFPDNIVFAGNRQEQCIQVGNAVPISLGEAIGKQIRSELLGYTGKINVSKGQEVHGEYPAMVQSK